jgi:hypothetical protein
VIFSGTHERVMAFTCKIMGVSFSVSKFSPNKQFHGTNYICKLRDACILYEEYGKMVKGKAIPVTGRGAL